MNKTTIKLFSRGSETQCKWVYNDSYRLMSESSISRDCIFPLVLNIIDAANFHSFHKKNLMLSMYYVCVYDHVDVERSLMIPYL